MKQGIAGSSPVDHPKKKENDVANVEKKIKKLKEQLVDLETQLRVALTKKDSKLAEVNVPALTARIKTLKEQIAQLAK